MGKYKKGELIKNCVGAGYAIGTKIMEGRYAYEKWNENPENRLLPSDGFAD